MRKILYKNLTGLNNMKQDLCIREVIAKEDFLATIERRCVYFVREKIYIEDAKDIENLACSKKESDVWKKKHFHILRHHDSTTGEDKLLCKACGTFYAVFGHYLFCIAFVHSFKIDLALVTAQGEHT